MEVSKYVRAMRAKQMEAESGNNGEDGGLEAEAKIGRDNEDEQ